MRRPFVVAVVTERSIDDARQALTRAFRDGADAAELNLACLPRASAALFKTHPVYTSCRRARFMRVYGTAFARLPVLDDEARMTRQMDSLAAGSCGMDIEADCFAPATDEWTTDRGAVRQQQWLAARAHAQRRSVIFSWHPGRKLSLSEARRRAQQLRDRGADFVKIVETVASDEEALDTVRISLALRRELNFPFVFLALGEAALRFRPFMTHFGAAYLLARPAGGENRIGAQPLVAPARTIVDLR